MFEKDQGANYGPELSALANCWKDEFGGEDPHFFYTIPAKALAPKITQPEADQGRQHRDRDQRLAARQPRRADRQGSRRIVAECSCVRSVQWGLSASLIDLRQSVAP